LDSLLGKSLGCSFYEVGDINLRIPEEEVDSDSAYSILNWFIMAHKLLVVFLSALALVPTAQGHETLKRSTLEKRACKSYTAYRVDIFTLPIHIPFTPQLFLNPLITPT
jgi:hypothetical protein